ncbi:MAG TPA: hypothetical protein VNC78_00355 [Actinomycetota bacterium]|nr:hypothetical protein [Actinomycetota bacterium]
MRHRILFAIFAALLAFGSVACGGGDATEPDAPDAAASEDAEASAPTGPQQVAVTMEDEAITIGTATLEASPSEVTITNNGEKKSFVFFGRLNDDVTVEDLEKSIGKSPDAAFGLVTAAGGAEVDAGGTFELVVEFPVGTYIVGNPNSFDTIAPAFFDVVDPTTTIEEPEAEWALETGDFYFKIDEGISAGPIKFVITNAGKQSHEVIITGEKDDPETGQGAFSIAPAPGGAIWTTFELEAGNYTAICYFPDPKTGKPHFKLGMKQKFTVE